MYQVVKMFGDWEPWWFIEGWEEDITEIAEYDTLSEALLYFQEEWDRGQERWPYFQSKSSLLATFWSIKEKRWCEECDEYLQQYHSLMLLKEWQEIPKEESIERFEVFNKIAELPSACSLNL
ncbi:TPA: DUF1033 family protein [Streptococcus agalactiae]|uniref:DUF1033 family protein n=1 Tax=Streptococcus agalactiae TaxID=1311 RepID=UPI0008106CEC|nr:DUF1033 family protein [Streptococcus agalactiae]EMC0663360.1 DUF1033 family protein [Streptococcus agalactiae]OCM12394.1 dipicolinate synthase [Streptococcus agalactiae]OCM21437.1 dipicolinate synthase [Streptococcus agalactiae]OCM28022.1 dipicolinate synthase [Streptococcus agalactiae]OCM33722.1 dipicolinate synthase [Streptococcus agalactiae]